MIKDSASLTKKLPLLIGLGLFLLMQNPLMAADRIGRLGLGMSNQLKNDIPSLSFKLQKSNSYAFGGIVGLNTSDDSGGYGAGLKIFKVLFDEPQLNFYGAAMGALVKKKIGATEESGFQIDLTLGSEFYFSGLSSLGFSFEFGVSLNKLKDFIIETVGSPFIVVAVHFYL